MNSPDKSGQPDQGSHEPLSQFLVQAREAAGLDIGALSNETRLARDFISALESGQYDKLPAPPYVRAFLVTLSRRLKLDADQVIRMFNQEAGTVLPERSQARLETISSAPPKSIRKTPVIIIGVLLVILVFSLIRFRRVSTPVPEQENTEPQAEITDEGVSPFLEPLPEDPDSSDITAAEDLKEKIPDSDPTDASSPPPPPIAPIREKPVVQANVRSGGSSTAAIRSIVDSVWVSVHRKGKKESNKILLKNETWNVTHTDTIFVHSGVINGIEVTMGNQIRIPVHRKFILFDGTLSE